MAKVDEPQVTRIGPQPGPQTMMLESSADVVIFGGAAGGGKTWSLLLEPLRHADNPEFGAVLFRNTYPQIMAEKGPWEEASKLYPMVNAKPLMGRVQWRFPSGAKVSMSYLQADTDVYHWKGAAIALMLFDELTEFSAYQFFYMLSRNRSTSGVKPYVRATTNPDADSWVAGFISWWIDEDGFAIPERSGVIRYFIQEDDIVYWADTKEELYARFPHLLEIKDMIGVDPMLSCTFILSKITDNKILMKQDPVYYAKLMTLPKVERERLLNGNWKIKVSAGKFINRAWFPIVDAAPVGGIDVRGIDFAATAQELSGRGSREADWTAMVKIRRVKGRYYVLDYQEEQVAPAESEILLVNVAAQDRAEALACGAEYRVRWGMGKGDAGQRDNVRLVKSLDGYDAAGINETGDKYARARPFAAQAHVGNVLVVRGDWNDKYLKRLHNLPDGKDDALDGTNNAYLGAQDEEPVASGQSSGAFNITPVLRSTNRYIRRRPDKRRGAYR
jgi:predicted phage terminase large subunit-like protein